jgi:1-acyl-sn-glycerol-3-phosphate acyltransferase
MNGTRIQPSMTAVLRGLRSFLSVLLVGPLFMLGSVVLRLGVLPTVWLRPELRFVLVSLFMKGISHGILGLLRLGGARFRRRGEIPTASPVVVVANHQGLVDILQITLLSHPCVPAFVTRRRYARFVPLVSASVRLLGSPIIDPKRDANGAVEAIRRGAIELPHGMTIFPEGHRSLDGAVRPFRMAGLAAIFEVRRVPVYLVVSDGVWHGRRLVDLLFRVHLMNASAEVLGPYEIPGNPAEIPAFIAGLREIIVARLRERRDARAGAHPA